MASKKKTPASPSKEEVAPVAKKATKAKTYEQGVEDGLRRAEKVLEVFLKDELSTLKQFMKDEMKGSSPDFADLLQAKSEEGTYEFLKSALNAGWLLRS